MSLFLYVNHRELRPNKGAKMAQSIAALAINLVKLPAAQDNKAEAHTAEEEVGKRRQCPGLDPAADG